MRKALVALLAAGMLAITAWVPAMAHTAGTGEETTDDQGNTTYSNQVDCGDTNQLPAGPVVVNGEQNEAGTGGEIAVCQETADLPVQGRVIAAGDAQSGGYVAADGDADNQPEQATGWARVDVSGDGVTVRCGDPAGNLAADHPTEVDGQEDCG
jgi:hypothetical protein